MPDISASATPTAVASAVLIARGATGEDDLDVDVRVDAEAVRAISGGRGLADVEAAPGHLTVVARQFGLDDDAACRRLVEVPDGAADLCARLDGRVDAGVGVVVHG